MIQVELYAATLDNHLIILSETGVADPIPPLDSDVAEINALLDGELLLVHSEPMGSQESLFKKKLPTQSSLPHYPPAFTYYPIGGEDLLILDRWKREPINHNSKEVMTGQLTPMSLVFKTCTYQLTAGGISDLAKIISMIPIIKKESPLPLTLAAWKALPLAPSTKNLDMLTATMPALHLIPPEVLSEMHNLITQNPQEVENPSLQLPQLDVLRDMQDSTNQHPNKTLESIVISHLRLIAILVIILAVGKNCFPLFLFLI